jgi:hypothetical protein
VHWYQQLNRSHNFHEVRCTNFVKTKEVQQALVRENRLKSRPTLVVQQGQGLIIIIIIIIIIEASRSHSDTPQSVELIWTGDQPDAQTST